MERDEETELWRRIRRALFAGPPPADGDAFAAAVMARLEAAEAPRRSWLPRWVPGLAFAGTAAAVLLGLAVNGEPVAAEDLLLASAPSWEAGAPPAGPDELIGVDLGAP